MKTPSDLHSSTISGSICSIWASFTFGDLLHTMVMAAIGTIVSYAVSKLLQYYSNSKKY